MAVQYSGSGDASRGWSARFVAAVRRVPGKAWLRLAILVGLLAAGFVLVTWTPVGDYFTQEKVIELRDELHAWRWTPLVLIGLYVAVTPLGFVPVSPLVFAGGFVYGVAAGSVYNLVGLLLAAMAGYYVAKALGREFVVRLAGPRLRRAERVFERQGFWPLVQTRYLPVPFALVSYGAALAGVRASRFLITSAIGLAPATLIHTYFMPALVLDYSWLKLVLYVGVLALFNVAIGWQGLRQRWLRRRRYRELVERRQRRG